MRISRKALMNTVLAGSAFAYLSGMAILAGFAVSAKNLPDPKKLWERNRPVSVQIVDRNGRDILIRGAAVERPVDLDILPFHIPVTFLATEDERFRNHIGIDQNPGRTIQFKNGPVFIRNRSNVLCLGCALSILCGQ